MNNLATLLAQLDVAIDSAAKLSGQNDRVLFLLTLILFFFAGGVAVRWFMKQLDKRDVKIESLSVEMGHVRETFNAYLIGSLKDVSKIVAENTTAIERNSEVFSTLERALVEKKLTLPVS